MNEDSPHRPPVVKRERYDAERSTRMIAIGIFVWLFLVPGVALMTTLLVLHVMDALLGYH